MTYKIIIGDNSKILQSDILPEYIGNIKMIYIDPPYNTQTIKSYEDGINTDDWSISLKDILTKLHTYLKTDGVIFISIDDSEYANLKIICDQIFNKENCVGTFITKQSQRSNSKYINVVHEYILCYAKHKSELQPFMINRMDIPEQRDMINDISSIVYNEFLSNGQNSAEKILSTLIKKYCDKYGITWLKNYNCVDSEGQVYFASDLSVPSAPREVIIPSINLHLKPLKTRGWVSDKKFIELYNKNLLVFRDDRPYIKKYLKDSKDNAPSILNFYSRQGTNDLNKLGLRGIFDTPKPVELLKFLMRIANLKSNDNVLDCYAGSGTTMQAVIELNQEDNKNVNCILIQRKEKINTKTTIYANCLKYGLSPYVSEILKFRIQTVFNKYNLNLNNLEVIDNYE